jgi:hypothetical protein
MSTYSEQIDDCIEFVDRYKENLDLDAKTNASQPELEVLTAKDIKELKHLDEYWQQEKLKHWSLKYKENKKPDFSSFEYLL